MESETLRKIQVKHGHGLAGSFKDRPIAEWLQIQNPTELDYQKVNHMPSDALNSTVISKLMSMLHRSDYR